MEERFEKSKWKEKLTNFMSDLNDLSTIILSASSITNIFTKSPSNPFRNRLRSRPNVPTAICQVPLLTLPKLSLSLSIPPMHLTHVTPMYCPNFRNSARIYQKGNVNIRMLTNFKLSNLSFTCSASSLVGASTNALQSGFCKSKR